MQKLSSIIMKGVFSLCFVFCIFTISTAQNSDFRNHSWGASKESIQQSETGKLVLTEPDRLIYDISIGGSNVKVVYTFTSNGKLMRAKYLFAPNYFNSVYYIRDFKLYVETLTAKYGKPLGISPKVITKSSIKEDEWAAYLVAGELFVQSSWQTERTKILLTMSKVDTYPAIQIDYVSIAFDKEDLAEKKAQYLKEF